MKRTTEQGAPSTKGDDVVLMYPDNQLTKQVRKFGEGVTAFGVIKEAFFTKKNEAPAS